MSKDFMKSITADHSVNPDCYVFTSARIGSSCEKHPFESSLTIYFDNKTRSFSHEWLPLTRLFSPHHVHPDNNAPMLLPTDSTDNASTITRFLNSTTDTTLSISSSIEVLLPQLELPFLTVM